MSPKQDSAIQHLKDLIPDPRNARKHTPRNVGSIVSALHEVGAARSIVIDEDGVVLAGNATIEAAAEAGITKVQVVDADGETVVAVRRSGLTPEQKTRLALFDNRAAELAEWDTEVLRGLADEGALAGMFSEDELAALLETGESKDGLTDPDDVPAERATDIVAGDLFSLGKHLLLCGDSTKADDVARVLAGAVPLLMVTDPPYGVDYDANWRNEAADKGLIAHAASRVGKVANDDQSDWTEAWRLSPAVVAYCWYASLFHNSVQASLEMAGFTLRSEIVWAKPRFAISRGHYHWQHESCLYAVKNGATAKWIGDRSQTTLWTVSLDKNVDGGHSTQKPVELMLRSIRNHEGDVYEPFSGSGTTLIACEQLGRVCHAIEIEPRYVQVAIDRWEQFTGQKAVKVGEAVRA